MTVFTLIVSLSRFRNIPKALSSRILSKSRLTDWEFADKPSWGKDFKISLPFDTNLVKWNLPFLFLTTQLAIQGESILLDI